MTAYYIPLMNLHGTYLEETRKFCFPNREITNYDIMKSSSNEFFCLNDVLIFE